MSRILHRLRRPPNQTCRTFLRNHVGKISVVATAAGALKHLIGIGGALEAGGVLLAISAVALARLTLREPAASAC